MDLFVAFDRLPGGPESEARFIEVEDRGGASHGEDVGVRWETVSPMTGPGRVLLGPFLSAQHVGIALGRLYGCLIDPGDLEQVPERHREDVAVALHPDGGVQLKSAIPPPLFLEIWQNCLAAVESDAIHPDE